MAEEKLIGKITHYFGNIGVGIIGLTDSLRVGDKIRVKDSAADFEQVVGSMQVDHKEISEAKTGDEVGVKLEQKAKEGDKVYKVL